MAAGRLDGEDEKESLEEELVPSGGPFTQTETGVHARAKRAFTPTEIRK